MWNSGHDVRGICIKGGGKEERRGREMSFILECWYWTTAVWWKRFNFHQQIVTSNTIEIVSWKGKATRIYGRLEWVPWILMLQPSEAGLEAQVMVQLQLHVLTINVNEWLALIDVCKIEGCFFSWRSMAYHDRPNTTSFNTFNTWCLYWIVLTLPFRWKISLTKIMTNI